MLKFKLTKDEFNEIETSDDTKQFAPLYIEKDGEYFLQVEGAVSTDKVKEFRQSNIDLMKENDQLKADMKKYEGIEDPEAAATAIQKLKEIDEEKLKTKEELDELLEQRTSRLKQDYDAQVQDLSKKIEKKQQEYDDLYGRHAGIVIDNEIQNAVLSVGKPLEGTMEDIVARGRRVFKMNNEFKPEARDPNSGDPLFSKDGTSPLNINEWAEELPQNAPWFFDQTKGADSRGGPGGGQGGKTFGGKSKAELQKMTAAERLRHLHNVGATNQRASG